MELARCRIVLVFDEVKYFEFNIFFCAIIQLIYRIEFCENGLELARLPDQIYRKP